MYCLIIWDNGDRSVGINPTSYTIQTPFCKEDADDEIKQQFKDEMLNVYKEYAEGRMTAWYEDENTTYDEDLPDLQHLQIDDTVAWQEAKLQVHDTSGITLPEQYRWKRRNGVYYPIQ